MIPMSTSPGKSRSKALWISIFAFAIFISAASMEAQQQNAKAARVWEAQLSIPTYELGPPDPNPAFASAQGRSRRPVYPYPMLDNLTGRKVDKVYRAVYLENEYLRVTVLPELGGHLYAIFDKTASRDVLYTNHVIKYGMVGIRGAWVSGGIEWNFPDGHTVTTVSPIDYTLETGPDGSASVTVGDTERIQRMQWAVTVRLYPGRNYVETAVTLHNRRPTPGRYWYWSTAAAQATDDLRFVYPMREAYPHTFWPVYSFPKEKGIDLSTYREVPNALSLFARNSKRDFFGVYYEKSDWGIVHVADHREMAGKKTWTWGTDPSGAIWVDKLTDRDGQYVEFQAGRFETQMEHEFISPHRVERYVEYWCPLQKLGGGWDEANKDSALRIEVAERRAHITFNVTSRFDDAEVTVERGDDQPFKQRLTLIPGRAASVPVDLGMKGMGKPLIVRLVSRQGQEIISYRTDLPKDGNPDFKPARRPVPDPPVSSSAEQAFLAGVAADKKSDERAARTAYQEALAKDPAFSPALIALGLSYYRSGEFDKAESQLLTALGRDMDSADAHYYLGLVLRAVGRVREAADHLLWNVRSGQREAEARYLLGEIALAAGRPNEAVEMLTPAVRYSPGIKILTVYALARRLTGDLENARSAVDRVVGFMPLDYFALHERYLVYKAAGKDDESRRSWDELWRLLSREPDSVLELVFDYMEAGQTAECRRVLEEAIRRASEAKRPVYPMIHYALGYFLEQGGDKAAAGEQYALGAKGDPALVFPHRPEELVILRSAIAANTADGRASYYLGSVLAGLNRMEEALPAFALATVTDKGNSIAWRNYALALWRVAGKREEAVQAYSRSIAAAPDDYHHYVERDALLRSMGATSQRIRLLDAAPDQVKARSAVVQALASAYVDDGRFASAIRLLEGASITSGEGETGGLSIYRRACLGLAGQYRKDGKHAEAAAQFLKATEYPRNFGVGRSSTSSHARELVAAARELEAAGNKEASASLWRRAAEEPLQSPVEPGESWSENYYYKAVALEHVGRSDDARALYRRLAGLADDQQMKLAEPAPPGGAVRFLLAGLGLKALGEQEKARAALGKALQIDPANELAKAELASLETPRQKE